MASMETTNYSLNFSSRNRETHNTVMDLNMSFEDPTQDELKNRMNTWLKALGHDLEVVSTT